MPAARNWLSAACVAYVGIAAASLNPAAAQSYPAKPVRFIIPFAPGGGNDIIGRAIAAKLTEAWKQQMVVDNRPGAGGNIAGEITARAAPDGHTVFQFNIANVIAASIYPKLAYDPVRDFAPVTQIGGSPFLLVVHPSVRANDVRELIALAKAQPTLLNYASSGNGGSTHLVTELFKSMAGISMTHIPYNGAGPALTTLLSGQVQLFFMVPATSWAHIKAGRLRALAVSSAQRSKLMPELPTVAESGVAGFEGSTWYGVVVPARTPPAIVTQLNRDIVAVLNEPDMRERMSNQGIELVASSPDAFARFIQAEHAKWARAVKISGARVD